MPNPIINEKVGALIVNGYTRGRIADELGISRPALRAKLRGDSSWKFEEVVKISNLLGCSLDEFVGEISA